MSDDNKRKAEMRVNFEANFQVPGGVTWDGSEYVADIDCMHSYRVNGFIAQWRAWQAAVAFVAASAQAEPAMVDMVPPATARDRWMYEQGRLAERDARTHAGLVLVPREPTEAVDHAGNMLSNIAFNLGQRSPGQILTADNISALKAACRQWDDARRAMIEAAQPSAASVREKP